jgi:hypothetical protein
MAAYTPAMLEVRAYRRGDEAAINAGFNRVFGHQRSEAVWQWKFRQPAARGSTVVAFDGRDLAAHNGGIPARWQVDGVEVAALQGVDTFSLAAIERRREWKNAWLDVMTFFAEKIAREDGVELLFGFTGPRSEPHMVSRCGWDAEDPAAPHPAAHPNRRAARPDHGVPVVRGPADRRPGGAAGPFVGPGAQPVSGLHRA